MFTSGFVLLCLLSTVRCGYRQDDTEESEWTWLDTDPIVKSPQGQFTGVARLFSHDDLEGDWLVHVYMGIPYAEPPIGELRFQPPKAKVPVGDWDATYFREVCPQLSLPVFESQATDENCLYLNIFVPQSSEAVASKKAVVIWMHGGAFYISSGSAPEHDGTVMSALGNIIVVTINYRLGPLGFLSTGDEVATGNYGLLDQRQAIIWVRENIEAFGGDIDRITVMGESAGAASIGLHLLSHGSRGLFKRAIMQSGSGHSPWAIVPSSEVARKRSFALGELVGCSHTTTSQLIQCLRQVPADSLVQAQLLVTNKTGEAKNAIAFTPIVDGVFLADTPTNLFEQKNPVNQADILIGSNADEGTMSLLFMFPHLSNITNPVINHTIFDHVTPQIIYNNHNSLILESIKFMYTDWNTADSEHTNYFQSLSQMSGDESFTCPADLFAKQYFERGNTVYMYHFSHHPSTSIYNTSWLGASHAEEIPFVFGWHFHRHMDMVYKPEEFYLSLYILSYWTSFIKTGNPTTYMEGQRTPDIPEWPPFTVPDLQYKICRLAWKPDEH
uniref:Carboxylic ester hydrolase n=1 Tax=Saccoglossus kowalevskii TaxID=10224 RepID=A0ABM0MF02_SACKO|nr:PREDICTED: cholinesterase-like [Saccoglossus kowalevskii]